MCLQRFIRLTARSGSNWKKSRFSLKNRPGSVIHLLSWTIYAASPPDWLDQLCQALESAPQIRMKDEG